MSKEKTEQELEMGTISEENNIKDKDVVNEKEDKNSSLEEEKTDNQIENEKSEEGILEKKEEEINQLKEQIQRLAAEFDNYKKRTAKEKDRIYDTSVVDVVAAFLPVLDNMELALKASENSEGNDNTIRDGISLIYRQMQETLEKLNIKKIEAIGKQFDPELHEAVMHVKDDEYTDNEIIEEFRKGYIYKDEIVIRHSVVKVAN